MHPSNRAGRHRSADMGRRVVTGPAVAQLVAPAEVGVEAVEDVDAVLELAQGHVPERWPDRAPDVASCRLSGGQLVVDDLDPPVEQMGDGGVLARAALGLDVRDQAFGVGLRVAAMLAALAPQVGLLAGDGSLPAYTRARKPVRNVSIEPLGMGRQ